MEEKKFDVNSLIGFALLFLIMIWYFYTNQPTPEQLEKQRAEHVQDSIQKAQQNKPVEQEKSNGITAIVPTDSVALATAKSQLGDFAYSATLPSAKAQETSIENDLLKITVANKGGQITGVELKKFKTYDQQPLYLIKNGNTLFNINFSTQDNRTLNTSDLYFEPTLSQNGENQVLSMKLKVAADRFLEYRYEIKPNDYMLDFGIRSQGMSNAINTSQSVNLEWDLKARRQEKSLRAENMYTEMYYKYDDEISYLSKGKEDEETEKDFKWAAYKQHFFTSILKTDTPLSSANIISKNLVQDEDIDTVFTKQFLLKASLEAKNGEFNYAMNWYFGPTDYKVFKEYKGTGFDEVADLGWGIFGWINRYIFYPVFDFLKMFIGNYGIIIILMTIVTRILMSPVVYKSYVSSAKMKVLRPEMNEINEKYPGKENAMKRQQEMMALQNKAGVSPLSGCIPALLQMPVFFALFRFFPSNIELRQKSFLWAHDLSSYDIIAKLPFKIPFYGEHVSLFPILASVAIFFYMRMTQSQQMNMQPPTQEGMPDMTQMMKIMMWMSPIMMLFFFNNYASGLSLYYFISNLLTIAIMLVIKNYVIDEDKIHAKIQENKARPDKPKSKFRQRIDEAMKQAQEQQATQQRRKK